MITDINMDDQDRWCQFFTAALSRDIPLGSMEHRTSSSAKIADLALEELRTRKEKKFFDRNEKGYRG